MVGLVIVSHSAKIAEGLRDLALQMAPDYDRLIPAGGLEDGTLGTDPMRILDAVRRADNGDGVVILVDLGSGIMSAETAIDLLDGSVPARIADAPMVEGAVMAVIEAAAGASLEEVIQAAENTRNDSKLQ